jgi:hypothetical protein
LIVEVAIADSIGGQFGRWVDELAQRQKTKRF